MWSSISTRWDCAYHPPRLDADAVRVLMVSTISQTRHERLATRDEYSSAHNKWHPHLCEKASTLPKHPSDNLEVEPEALPLSADHTTRGQPALHVLVEVGRVSIKDLVSMPLALPVQIHHSQMYVMAPHCQHAPHRNHTRTPNGSDRTLVKRGGKTHSVSAGPTGSDESTIITSNLRPLLASSYNQTDSLLRLRTMHTSASRRHVRKKNWNKKK